MAREHNGSKIDSGTLILSLDATGAGSGRVLFAERFSAPPQLVPQRIRADAGGSWTTTTTELQGTISVSGSDLTDTHVEIAWVAIEDR